MEQSQLTLLSEEPPVSHSRSLEDERDWIIQTATSPLSFLEFARKHVPSGSYGKMCLESCPQTMDETSSRSGKKWRSAGIQSPGESLMLDLHEAGHIPLQCHNDADVCLLSDILETTGDHLRRYFLTPKACRGILLRAERRGRRLPTHLYKALAAVAHALKSPER